MKRLLAYIILFVLIAVSQSEAAKRISCISASSQTCTVSMVSISGTTPTTVFTDQALTETILVHGMSDYYYQYGSDLDSTLEYRVVCNCSSIGAWSYTYEPFETRLTATPPTSADIKTALEADGSKLDHLWEMTEDDGGVRRLTTNALEQAPAGGGGSSLTAQQVWIYGTRSLTSPPVVLPVMQGQIYEAVAAESREVVIVRGDSPRITFDLGADYTGWTPKFGAKASPSTITYTIAIKDAVWTAAALGQGYVDLTATETAAVAKLSAEIELRNGDQRLTAIKFKLTIREDVIR